MRRSQSIYFLRLFDTHLVPVALDCPNITIAYASQPFKSFSVADVASQEHLLNLAWDQQFLEFGRQVVRTYWDVQVANDQNKD